MNFIKPFDIPFLFTLPSLLHINVITGNLQTYDTDPKAPANIYILVRSLKEAVHPLKILFRKFPYKYLQTYESIQNPEDLLQDPWKSSSNRNRIQTKREIKLSI